MIRDTEENKMLLWNTQGWRLLAPPWTKGSAVSARSKSGVFDILLLWSANSDSTPECRSDAPLHCKHSHPDMGRNKCLHLYRQASALEQSILSG